MSGKLLILKPNGEREEIDHSGPGIVPLPVLSNAINGYLERLRVRMNERELSGYVDEDGRRKGLPRNPYAVAILTKPYDPLDERHQVMGNMAVWMPDTRNIDRIAQGVLLMLVTGLSAAGFQPVKINASSLDDISDWQTLPPIEEADLIQQAFLNDRCFIYFRHPSLSEASFVILELDNGIEMIVDSWSPDNNFYKTMAKIQKDIFDEFED